MERNKLIRDLISELDNSNDGLLIELLKQSIDKSKVRIESYNTDVSSDVYKVWMINIKNYFKDELLKQEPFKSIYDRKKRVESLIPNCETCKYQPDKYVDPYEMFDYTDVFDPDHEVISEDQVEYLNRINNYTVQKRCLGCAKAALKLLPEIGRVNSIISEKASLLFDNFKQLETYEDVLNTKCIITELKSKIKETQTRLKQN